MELIEHEVLVEGPTGSTPAGDFLAVFSCRAGKGAAVGRGRRLIGRGGRPI